MTNSKEVHRPLVYQPSGADWAVHFSAIENFSSDDVLQLDARQMRPSECAKVWRECASKWGPEGFTTAQELGNMYISVISYLMVNGSNLAAHPRHRELTIVINGKTCPLFVLIDACDNNDVTRFARANADFAVSLIQLNFSLNRHLQRKFTCARDHEYYNFDFSDGCTNIPLYADEWIKNHRAGRQPKYD